jgi:hypothetical protein
MSETIEAPNTNIPYIDKTRIVSRAATISILADSVTTGRDAEAAFKRRSQLRSLRPHASRP